MGAQQSKVRISIPPKVSCFPGYRNEQELFKTSKKIQDCHIQAVQIASWIGSVLFPTFSPSPIVFSAATMLFTFLLERLSAALTSEDTDNEDETHKTKPVPDRSLEDALIDAKVSTEIAKKSVCELQAKIHIVKNRYYRLLSEISLDDRRLEVVPGIQTCEEILQLFHDPTHVFRRYPLVSSPFLVTFAGIFVAVAELSLTLIPSYKEPLVKEMKLLAETLSIYKDACIKTRMSGLSFQNVQRETMLDVVAGAKELNYTLEDASLPKTARVGLFGSKAAPAVNIPDDDIESLEEDEIIALTRDYDNANEAITSYKNLLEEKYSTFFETALEVTSQFRGFKVEGSSSEYYDLDSEELVDEDEDEDE